MVITDSETIQANVPFVVITATVVVTMDDFVKSGKFCQIYGHNWIHSIEYLIGDKQFYDPNGLSKCAYCKKTMGGKKK